MLIASILEILNPISFLKLEIVNLIFFYLYFDFKVILILIIFHQQMS